MHRPLTVSERADELEEQMMHELSERIATRSTLFYLGDGKVQMDSATSSWPPILESIF